MNEMHVGTTADANFAVLASSGEMGGRTRVFDWSQTPVGPLADWPQSLKTIVQIMLESRYAMWLGWGSALTFFYNDAYAKMTLGPKHPWALGQSARDVWAEIWGDIGPRADSVMRTGQATWDEGLLLFLERRGFTEETYHSFSYSPVRDEGGNIGGLLCVVTEDTERTIAERRLRTLRELAARTTEEAKSAEEAYQIAARILNNNAYDLPFVLLYMLDENGRWAKLAGQSGIVGNTRVSPSFIDLDGSDVPWPFQRVIAQGEAVQVEHLTDQFGPLPGGPWPESPQHAIVLPMRKSGQARLAGFIVAGISPRRPFDEAYRGFMELLAGQIATAVSHASAYEEERRRAESLAELDRAKTAFFSNVSHEFRTPLTLMLGPLDDLLTGGAGELSPAAKAELEVVHRNGLRLLKLVNTLLDFSRIEAGRLRAIYQATELGAFTADLASVFRSAVERAGMRLIVDCPPLPEPVYVDRDLWEKVVLNLLSNAFKFTFEGEIEVSLRTVGQTVELRVRDTGTGIPPDELPRLFERFHRVENARGRSFEGSGIGLALVLELVKLHGGSVRVESTEGKGSTFIVGVPLGSAHLRPDQIKRTETFAATATGGAVYIEEALRWLGDEPQIEAEGWTAPSPDVAALSIAKQSVDSHSIARTRNQARVLVADDNADLRQYLARLLSEHYSVEAVADGEAALTAARERPPDLLLTDVMMPRLDGFALLQALRGDPSTAAMPVILLSARAGEDARVEGLKAGADDYLVKPFSARELLARVGATLAIANVRRDAEARVTRTLESITDGLVILDRQWRYTYVNAEAELLLRQPRAALLGQCVWEVFPAVVGTAIEVSLRKTFAEQIACEFEGYDEESGRWYENKSYPTLDGVTVYFRDITERKLAEESLRDADRRKDEFLAMLAHELRNPLAPLKSGLQILHLSGFERASAEQKRALAIMERQLEQMVRLIDDLMDISRISRGKINLETERVTLATVVQQAVETSRPVIEQVGHDLVLNVPSQPLVVRADSTRLAQVFANLLNNAAKYTKPGGRIALAVQRDGKEAVISVQDNGVGIAESMLDKVFDMFTQVEGSLGRAQGGLGIGLTLVRQIVQLHGGRVEAKSEGLGRGSEFIVRLPLDFSPAEEVEKNDDHENPSTASRRILVVDDNPDAADSLTMILTMLGHETKTAYDGQDAFETAAVFLPELMVLDIGMPSLSGYEVAERIRRAPWGENIVLVALTGWGQEADLRRSKVAGFDQHLVKPVDFATVEKLLAATWSG